MLRLTDPATMRALAHPIRLALLWHLLEIDTATATECAEVVDESPASCSYHLRRLADAGFIAVVPSDDGRERRWRLVMRGFDLAHDTPEQRAAALAVEEQLFQQDTAIVREFRRARDTYSKRWQRAAADWRSTVHLTAKELADLSAAFSELVQPFVDRDRRNDRPAGAERVHLVFVGMPWRPRPAPPPEAAG